MLKLLSPEDFLPPASQALRVPNGLVAAGGALTVDWLLRAYSQGIFPWYSEGDPILWWSPTPRMVLTVENFRLHKSLFKRIKQWASEGDVTITINTDFAAVINHCAGPRNGTSGTWILPQMVAAYESLHHAGYAHSFEVRRAGVLIGGLYGVGIGHMFYGESMFTRQTDASKVALVALVNVLKQFGCPIVDCQQQTAHLASMGATPIPRELFLTQVKQLTQQPSLPWPHLHQKDMLPALANAIFKS